MSAPYVFYADFPVGWISSRNHRLYLRCCWHACEYIESLLLLQTPFSLRDSHHGWTDRNDTLIIIKNDNFSGISNFELSEVHCGIKYMFHQSTCELHVTFMF